MPFDSPPTPEDRKRLDAPLALKPLLMPAPRPAPDHEWQGRMRGLSGSARRADIDLRIRLRLGRSALAGEGCALGFPYNASDAQRAFAVDGPREGQTVRFEIVFGTAFFRDKPFCLTGSLNAQESEITETWTFSCGHCDCGCSHGTFTLTRIDLGR